MHAGEKAFWTVLILIAVLTLVFLLWQKHQRDEQVKQLRDTWFCLEMPSSSSCR